MSTSRPSVVCKSKNRSERQRYLRCLKTQEGTHRATNGVSTKATRSCLKLIKITSVVLRRMCFPSYIFFISTILQRWIIIEGIKVNLYTFSADQTWSYRPCHLVFILLGFINQNMDLAVVANIGVLRCTCLAKFCQNTYYSPGH